MNNNQTLLTIDDAYDAMVEFLDQYYTKTKSDDIGWLLGGMVFLTDGETADPVAWHNWMNAINKVFNANIPDIRKPKPIIQKLNLDQAYQAMINFLELCRRHINSDERQTLLNGMMLTENNKTSNPAWNNWFHAVNKVLSQNPRVRPMFELIKPE